MRLLRFAIVIAALAQAFPSAQVAMSSGDQLWFDKGVIADGVYKNQCLGFSFLIPAGWQENAIPGLAEGRALHLRAGALGLLMLHRSTAQPFGDSISLMAADLSKSSMTMQESVAASVRNVVSGDPQRREMVRDASPVQYGGHVFFRADYKHGFPNGTTQYGAYVYTKFRGYLVGGTMIATSPEALNEVVDSLARISFQEDVPNTQCVMGPNDGPLVGVIGSVSRSDQPGLAPSRVRVSRGVSQGLLIKSAPPEYPEAARLSHVEGTVVLDTKIDTNGDVEGVAAISGPPLLVPAAIAAVKHWKYKPYTLNGQPAKIETQALVVFQLPANN